MPNSFERLILLHNESVRLCKAIREMLQEERMALIALDTDKISEILLQKENMVQSLDGRRAQMDDIFRKELKVQTAEAFEMTLSKEQLGQWLEAKKEWQDQWGTVVILAQQNQRFLKHSLKNLSRFADHLKQLLGEPGRYSAKGDKVDSPSEGRMLEASC